MIGVSKERRLESVLDSLCAVLTCGNIRAHSSVYRLGAGVLVGATIDEIATL